MYYVYLLCSEGTKKLYKGMTNDLKRRLKEHNTGKVKATKASRPWKLVWYAGFVSKTDARREELFLKSGKGRERVKYMLRDTLGGMFRIG